MKRTFLPSFGEETNQETPKLRPRIPADLDLNMEIYEKVFKLWSINNLIYNEWITVPYAGYSFLMTAQY